MFFFVCFRVNCSADMANEKLLRNSMSSNESSSSSLGVMQSQISPRIVKNPKKVSKFYQKQSDLVENYKRDSTIIEVSFVGTNLDYNFYELPVERYHLYPFF